MLKLWLGLALRIRLLLMLRIALQLWLRLGLRLRRLGLGSQLRLSTYASAYIKALAPGSPRAWKKDQSLSYS